MWFILKRLSILFLWPIIKPQAKLYLPSPHLTIMWDAVICLNFCVILPPLMRGYHGKKKPPPTINLSLTPIRANELETLNTPTDIMHCWGAVRRQVMLTLQQIINERNQSTVAITCRHKLIRQPTQKRKNSLKLPKTN